MKQMRQPWWPKTSKPASQEKLVKAALCSVRSSTGLDISLFLWHSLLSLPISMERCSLKHQISPNRFSRILIRFSKPGIGVNMSCGKMISFRFTWLGASNHRSWKIRAWTDGRLRPRVFCNWTAVLISNLRKTKRLFWRFAKQLKLRRIYLAWIVCSKLLEIGSKIKENPGPFQNKTSTHLLLDSTSKPIHKMLKVWVSSVGNSST